MSEPNHYIRLNILLFAHRVKVSSEKSVYYINQDCWVTQSKTIDEQIKKCEKVERTRHWPSSQGLCFPFQRLDWKKRKSHCQFVCLLFIFRPAYAYFMSRSMYFKREKNRLEVIYISNEKQQLTNHFCTMLDFFRTIALRLKKMV